MSTHGRGTFGDNPLYRVYRALLQRLQELHHTGLQDGPEADAIREEMEESWYDLSPAEQERLSGLSADFSLLYDEEPLVALSAAEAAELRRGLAWCYQRRDWEGMLRLLRKGRHAFPEAVVAYARARAWRALGDTQAAAWFLEQARALDPDHDEEVLETAFETDEPRRPSAS
jgi:hypothetical protein